MRWTRIKRCAYHGQMGYAGAVDLRLGRRRAGRRRPEDQRRLASDHRPATGAYAKAISEASGGGRRIGILIKLGGHYLVRTTAARQTGPSFWCRCKTSPKSTGSRPTSRRYPDDCDCSNRKGAWTYCLPCSAALALFVPAKRASRPPTSRSTVRHCCGSPPSTSRG